ncbi:MAG: topoisomerase C-terminal repeat-containing protein, partial [Leeuwenhoekiella sp.]
VSVNNGRFGPYVKHGKKFISLPKGRDPLDVELKEAIEYIKEKQEADAPIYHYEEKPVQKGVGRFGPFIKWDGMFINVNKKYDFDNLSDEDLIQLIEDKKQKEKDKIIHNFEEEGIRVEKARWGRTNVIKGKTKVELPKTVDAKALTLEEVKDILSKKSGKKAKAKKTTAKKKAPAKAKAKSKTSTKKTKKTTSKKK